MAAMTALVTAYVATCLGCSGITASGRVADHEERLVAASRAWKFGTCVELRLPEEGWTRYTVADRGGKVRGKHRFDLLVATKAQAKAWGKKRIAYRRCRGGKKS